MRNERSTFLIMRTFMTLSCRLIHFLNTWSVLSFEPSPMSDGHNTGPGPSTCLPEASQVLNQLSLSLSFQSFKHVFIVQYIRGHFPPLCSHWLIASHTNNFTGWPEWILLDYISHFWEATICAGEVFHKHMSAVTHKCNVGEVRRKRGTQAEKNQIKFVKHRKWVSWWGPD